MEFHGRDDVIWHDRKRHFGLPISFTTYYMSEDRLFAETGFFTTRVESILLYRVRDIGFERTLGQKIFGVGSVKIISSDKTAPELVLKNIKAPAKISELLHENVEETKIKRRMRVSEIITESDGDAAFDGEFDD